MTPEEITATAAAFNLAELSAPAYRTGRILLDRAAAAGHITLTKPDLMGIARTRHWSTARRHLGELTKVGLIHYSTNRFVYVTFVLTECAPVLTECAPVLTECAPVLTECAPVLTECQPVLTECQPVLTECQPVLTERAHVVSTYVRNTNDTQSRTNERAIALLVDVGMTETDAKEFGNHHIDWLLRQVFAWQRDLNNPTKEIRYPARYLASRLRQRFSAPELTDAERATDLYKRHADASADGLAAQYLPAEYAGIIRG